MITCHRIFRERGGVALTLHKIFNYRVALKDTVREWLLVEKLSPIKIFVGVTYRCHLKFKEPQYLEWLAEECLRLCVNGRNLIIMGDFNIDLLKQMKYSTELLDIMSGHALKLCSPLAITRQQRDSKSCIDHIYSNLPVSMKKVYRCTITDHFFVWTRFETVLKLPKNTCSYRNYKNLEYHKREYNFLLNYLSYQTNWELVNLEDGFDKLIQIVSMAADKFAPVKTIVIKTKPWLDNKCKRLINKRDQLYLEYCLSINDQIKRDTFVHYRNYVKKHLNNRKKEFVQSSFSKCAHDSKSFHRNLNKVIGKMQKPNFPTITSQADVDSFNEFFANIGPALHKTIQSNTRSSNIPCQLHSMFLRQTDELETQKVLNEMKGKTSSGPDGVSSLLLKMSSNALTGPLTILINRCLRQGCFPKILKVAKVVPIYKEGDKEDYSNYRPISLLPVFGKVMERIIYARMIDFINKFKVLHDSQFGFR